MSDDKQIKLFRINPRIPVYVRRGPRERWWMDETTDKYAYRCLPLTIANQHGYELSLGYSISAIWDGGNGKDAIQITYESINTTVTKMIESHFGFGILTFSTNLLVRTPKNVNLHVSGPPNYPRQNIYPLTGIVETDWNPATFTMNWKFLHPNVKVTFPAFEPFCYFFPVQRGYIEDYEVVIKPIESDKEEHQKYFDWSESRRSFNEDLMKKQANNEQTWQKHYFQGKYIDGNSCPVTHQTKINLNDPKIEDDEL